MRRISLSFRPTHSFDSWIHRLLDFCCLFASSYRLAKRGATQAAVTGMGVQISSLEARVKKINLHAEVDPKTIEEQVS